MYIYIYQIAVDSWASVDLSLSLNVYILISFLHRVNQHHCSCPTNTILLIILFLIPWLWWDVTPRWSLCAVWCAWFPKLLEPPHPLSNYVSWIYHPDTFVKPISTLAPYSYYLPLPTFTYNISIYYNIAGCIRSGLIVVHDTVIQPVSKIFHIFNDRRLFINSFRLCPIILY